MYDSNVEMADASLAPPRAINPNKWPFMGIESSDLLPIAVTAFAKFPVATFAEEKLRVC